MGVIHKLRGDVVSYIIETKKNNPFIGVRRLANQISQRFQIKVSKSSVNSVLQKANLSSSVGRRPGSPVRSDKFSIPKAKKEQISRKMKEAGLVKEPDEDIPTEKPQDVQITEEKKEEQPTVAKEKETPLKKAAPKKEPARVQDFSVDGQKARQEKKGQERLIPDGAGYIFLKAAQWDVSANSLIAGLFQKHLQAPVSNHFNAVSDMFLFLRFLNTETFDPVLAYRGHGLWILNDFCATSEMEQKDLLELQELFKWEKALEDTPEQEQLIMEYQKIKEQSFFEVKGFKLLLEDRSELAIDASLCAFAGGGQIPSISYSTLPMHKAMVHLSNRLISNIQSAVFYKVPGEARFDRAFYDMVAIFEGLPGKRILKASVVDQQNEEIANFTTIPFQKRNFLIGIEPHQKEFGELTKAVRWPGKRSFYHAGTDRMVYFSETKTGFMANQVNEHVGDYRVIAVWEDGESDPSWAVLTNQQKGVPEEILKNYMSRWPYLAKTLQDDPVLVISPENEEDGKSRVNIYADFIKTLHRYCQKHFFPPAYAEMDVTQIITDIYSSPGKFRETEDSLHVRLNFDQKPAYQKDLEYAVKRVNEHHIMDYLGRRLWLEI